jgi:hypothetical protein
VREAVKHLTYENLREYIDMQEYSMDNADRFEQISEHIMECEKCSVMYERMLYASQLVDDFSVREYEGYLSLEQGLMERYQLEKLLISTVGKPVEDRIVAWIRKRLKGLESSIKVYLKDEKHNKFSGMVSNTMDRLSLLNTLEPLPAIAVRGEAPTDEFSKGFTHSRQAINFSSVLVSPDNKETKLILDGNHMQLTVQLESMLSYQKNPPIGILIGSEKEFEPLMQVAELKEGLYFIIFTNLQSGEYTFFLDT